MLPASTAGPGLPSPTTRPDLPPLSSWSPHPPRSHAASFKAKASVHSPFAITTGYHPSNVSSMELHRGASGVTSTLRSSMPLTAGRTSSPQHGSEGGGPRLAGGSPGLGGDVGEGEGAGTSAARSGSAEASHQSQGDGSSRGYADGGGSSAMLGMRFSGLSQAAAAGGGGGGRGGGGAGAAAVSRLVSGGHLGMMSSGGPGGPGHHMPTRGMGPGLSLLGMRSSGGEGAGGRRRSSSGTGAGLLSGDAPLMLPVRSRSPSGLPLYESLGGGLMMGVGGVGLGVPRDISASAADAAMSLVGLANAAEPPLLPPGEAGGGSPPSGAPQQAPPLRTSPGRAVKRQAPGGAAAASATANAPVGQSEGGLSPLSGSGRSPRAKKGRGGVR